MHPRFDRPEALLDYYLESHGKGDALVLEELLRDYPAAFEQRVRELYRQAMDWEDKLHDLATNPTPKAKPPIPQSLKERVAQLSGDRRLEARYEIRGELGRGGMGIVTRAWDSVLKREVAMKRIRMSSNGSGAAELRSIGRFLEEAQITAQLNHPGIVPIHDIGLDEHGDLYFTMHLVEGRTLAKILDEIKEGDPEWNSTRVIGVLLRVCETLAFTHERNVVHRDLKPANVIVGAFGAIYILDWGLARILDELLDAAASESAGVSKNGVESDRHADGASGSGLLTQLGDVVGTPAYMSPEQARGELELIGPQADVYSVGAMLYTLLVGRSPYSHPDETPSAEVVHRRLVAGPPASLAFAAHTQPEELIAICDKAMARSLDKRYASTLELAEDLRAYLEGRVVSAHRSDLRTVARKWVARNRGWSTTVAIATCLLVGSVVGWMISLKEQVAAKETALAGKEKALGDLETSTRINDRVDHRLQAEYLVHRAEQLFPAVPTLVGSLEKWITDADALLSHRGTHAADRATLGADSDAHTIQALDSVLAELDTLRTARERVADRLGLARTLEQRSITDNRTVWDDAIAAIASNSIYDDVYGRPLEIEAQLGLVPLGENPYSSLYEFWLIDSGARPTKLDGSSGDGEVAAKTGIVLVLLPGLDNDAHRIHPFFIGKYEVTQGQWKHVMAFNPSELSGERPGILRNGVRIPIDDRHPVDSVSWTEAWTFCTRYDLTLPSTFEWVHASSAGTSERPRWTGDEITSLLGQENIRFIDAQTHEDMADPFPFHAPAGSLSANPFGLFDTLGNVREWSYDAVKTRGEIDEPAVDALVSRDLRGGDFFSGPEVASVSTPGVARIDAKQFITGFRVARHVRPCPWCTTHGEIKHR